MGAVGEVITGMTHNPPQNKTPIKTKQTMESNAYIYFMTNTHNNVLYVGVTNNLARRVAEHKAKVNKGFTYKYNCDKLVYYETFTSIIVAISRLNYSCNQQRKTVEELETRMEKRTNKQ